MPGSAPEPRADIDKAALFRELGYGGEIGPYDAEIAGAGLTNIRKRRIARAKRDAVAAILGSRFFRACSRGDCKAAAPGLASGRRTVPASDPASCDVCAGSITRRAVDEMVGAAVAAGASRLCTVGGSPATREALAGAVAGRIRLRLVDGTATHTRAQAGDNARWADLVVIWGATELDHRVSALYAGPNVVTVPKRGVAELAACARDWFRARAAR